MPSQQQQQQAAAAVLAVLILYKDAAVRVLLQCERCLRCFALLVLLVLQSAAAVPCTAAERCFRACPAVKDTDLDLGWDSLSVW